MYIPPPASSADLDIGSITHFLKEGSGGGVVPEKWSSIIGIVTAICGNLLISVALNTQRYAHMRLNREREEWEMKRRKRRKGDRNTTSYGTQQSEIAEERARTNLESEPTKYPLEEPEDADETDALMPSVDTLDSRKSTKNTKEDSTSDGDTDASKEQSYLKSPIWWIGISLMTVGEAGNFLAYGFAPASIVSPLGVVALIANCLIAPLFLGERFRWRDGIGVVIAVAGCVTVVLSASTSNPKLTPDGIWSLITQWEFETYLGITVVLIIALIFASNRFGDKTILIDLGLMGLFGGYTALSTKGVASLLSNTLWKVVTFPITYLLVAVLVFTAVMQIKYVNRALQRFDATRVIPTQFVLFTLSVITGSAILYRDFERTTTEDALKFVGGCALTFLGVWFITSGRDDDPGTDEEMGEEEDAVDLIDEEGVYPEIRERDDNVDRRPSLLGGPSQRGSHARLQSTDSVPPNTMTPNEPASGVLTPQLELADSALQNKPAHMTPASAAAIHEQSASALADSNRESLLVDSQRPPMHATTSTPEISNINLPSSSRPKTSQRYASVAVSPTKAAPSTPQPRHPPSGQHLDPKDSQKLPTRHSMVGGLSFGPLTSPLSSSLSAVVADSLRRGVDHVPTSSARRRSLRRGATADPSGDSIKRRSRPDAAPLKRHSIASGEMDLSGEESPSRPSNRVRSFSAALGDVFGSGKRSQTESGESVPKTGHNGDGYGT